ncbi:MAG TPA: Gfo/Idh/MocA family oxidoreductase [Vicinamibacterales bacterium]|nr:Gfo/Idh/MocA family oxidoreductase [Vicinamibacterales bacterium]
MIRVLIAALLAFAAFQSPPESPAWAAKELRAGIIGTDTSHVPQFVRILHAHPEWKIKVVAAFKGGSPDLPLSATRVEGFAKTIQGDGVEIVDSIDTLLAKVDVVLLTSVDGRPHLAQVAPVFKAGKRVFIDKPLAASLEDVRSIVALSTQTRTPFFSASSVRFHRDIPGLRDAPRGSIETVDATYLLQPLEFHPDLFYYGIHGVEALYAVMGTGCTSLSRRKEGDVDVTTCTWRDGRVGRFRGLPKADSTQPLIRMTGKNRTVETSGAADNESIVAAIAEFFHTGRPPVDVAQTVEVFEFMTAAQLSKERGGAEVKLAELRK